MRSRVVCLGLVLALGGLAAPQAGARDWHVSLLGAGQVVAAPEFDPLASGDGLVLFQLELGLEIDEFVDGLSLELAYQTGGRNAALYTGSRQDLKTGLDLHGVTLAAVYRHPLTRWLNLSARLGGSLDFARLRVSSAEAGTLLRHWELARPGGFATLGLELALPRALWRRWLDRPAGDAQAGFTIGLRIEAGWQLCAPLDYGRVDPAVETPEGQDEAIARQPVDLGSLRLDGFLWRAGLYAVF